MPTLAEMQSSCAFASPHHLDQTLQRELTALAEPLRGRPSLSLLLVGRVARLEGREGGCCLPPSKRAI